MSLIKKVCEVGYLDLKTSCIREYILAGVQSMVIDVNNRTDLEEFDNVTFHQAAIIPEQRGVFYSWNNSTYWKAMLGYESAYNTLLLPRKKEFEAEGHKFSEFDKGDIDLLSIDIEGCELFVLQEMRSRPLIIRVEMLWKSYKNPFYDHILYWMKKNNYILFTKIQADYVFTRTKTI